MESALSVWQRRRGDSWIVGQSADALAAAVETQAKRFGGQLDRRERRRALRALLADATPAAAPAIVAALIAERPVRLCLWTRHADAAATAHVTRAFRPDVLLETSVNSSEPALLSGSDQGAEETFAGMEPMLLIATGGSSGGGVRLAAHTWQSMAAAARGLQRWLGGGPIHSVCFLPLHHVSGLMQLVRSFATGGSIVFAEWSQIEAGGLPPPPGEGAVTSLVPTQLARLLGAPAAVEWLRRFRAVFLGGAPAWPELLAQARELRLPLAPCYGMTETAAQVAALRPEEFLEGANHVGRALPHAQIEIADESGGAAYMTGVSGRIRVRASSLFHGYWPEVSRQPHEVFTTGDRGRIEANGQLTVLGRVDHLINSGGEKIDPAEVEAAIRATGLCSDVAVIGAPDAEWGEAVVAVVAGVEPGGEGEIAARVRETLARHKLPKRWVRVAALPRNEAGKLNREAVRARIAENDF